MGLKLIIAYLVYKFHSFYGTRRYIYMFTIACRWIWVRWNQSTSSHPIFFNIFALSCHLQVDFPGNLSRQIFFDYNIACINLILRSLLGSVGIATGCCQDGPKRREIILCVAASRSALWATQHQIKWVMGPLSMGYSGRGVKPTPHLHLEPKSRMVELNLLALRDTFLLFILIILVRECQFDFG
jgi:hypothetical protein